LGFLDQGSTLGMDTFLSWILHKTLFSF